MQRIPTPALFGALREKNHPEDRDYEIAGSTPEREGIMSNIIKRLEVVGSEICLCDLKYKDNEAVLERVIARATRLDPSIAPKFFYTESRHYTGPLTEAEIAANSGPAYEEISRVEISEEKFWNFE